MGELRLALKGPPYDQPRYYGKLQWGERDVYVRHPHGGKDSRHRNGQTYLTSTGEKRTVESRLPTSNVTRALVNYVELSTSLPEPPELRGEVRGDDFVLPTTSAGTAPRLAVEIVSDGRLDGVVEAWRSHSTAPSVQTFVDKGLGQNLVVAFAGSLDESPFTR